MDITQWGPGSSLGTLGRGPGIDMCAGVDSDDCSSWWNHPKVLFFGAPAESFIVYLLLLFFSYHNGVAAMTAHPGGTILKYSSLVL